MDAPTFAIIEVPTLAVIESEIWKRNNAKTSVSSESSLTTSEAAALNEGSCVYTVSPATVSIWWRAVASVEAFAGGAEPLHMADEQFPPLIIQMGIETLADKPRGHRLK